MIRKIFFCTLLFILSGCLNLEEEASFDYGTEASAESINQAMVKAISGTTPDSIQVNDFYEYYITQKFSNYSPSVTEETASRIVERTEQQDDQGNTIVTLTEALRTVTHTNGQQQKISKEKNHYYKKTSPNLKTQSLSEDLANSLLLKALSQSTEQLDDIRFYNLQVLPGKIAAPEAVSQRDHCENLSNCEISVTKIEFDSVNWSKREEGDKTHYTLIYSKDVPFFAMNLLKCLKFQAHINDEGANERHVTVEQCLVVRDFGFSQNQ